MFGALLKKQLLQLHKFYFYDAKKGKKRSPAGIVGMIVLFAFVIFSLGFSMMGIGDFILNLVHPLGMDWLFFAMMATLSIFAGILGGAFISYPTIYNAKDNDLLLSLPVHPRNIIASRMLSVFVMCFVYGAIVWIPTILIYVTRYSLNGIHLTFSIVLTFILAGIVLAISCLIGWIVALISSRIKNKSFASILISILIILIYYVCYFRLNYYMQLMQTYTQKIADFFETYLVVLAKVGRAATGDIPSFVFVFVFSALLFCITWYILQSTFIRVVTHSNKFKKTEFKRSAIREKPLSSSLYKKEVKRFWNCPAYVVNCGLSMLIELGLAVFILIRKDWIREYLGYILNIVEDIDITKFFSVAISLSVILLSSMAFVTAPSISLEGKNIWILQSLPIPAWKIYSAKQKLHIVLNAVPATIFVFASVYVFQIHWIDTIFIVLFVLSYICMHSVFGLLMNLKFPNMTWTNESVPVKQGLSVLFAMFGGWVYCIALGFAYFAVSEMVPGYVFLPIASCVMIFVTVLLNRYLYKKGDKLFAEL